jgi:hypothetical protein
MKPAQFAFLVEDPLAYLPRLGELGFSLAVERHREREFGAAGAIVRERFHTVFKNEGVQVSLEEYPFIRFVRIQGPAEQVRSLVRSLGFSEQDRVQESVAELFAAWRKERDLPPAGHLRFADYDR